MQPFYKKIEQLTGETTVFPINCSILINLFSVTGSADSRLIPKPVNALTIEKTGDNKLKKTNGK